MENVLLRKENITGKWGYVDSRGKLIINPQFDDAWDFTEGIAAVKENEKWGFINTDGTYIIEPQFEYARRFSEGLALVKICNKVGYIDKSGSYIIHPQYGYAHDFSEGIAAVRRCYDKEKEYKSKYNVCNWGYIDKKGNWVITPTFIEAKSFSCGLAPVQNSHGWGFINMQGNYVIQPQPKFVNAWEFIREVGLARVRIGDRGPGGKSMYIDKEGNLIPLQVAKTYFKRLREKI